MAVDTAMNEEGAAKDKGDTPSAKPNDSNRASKCHPSIKRNNNMASSRTELEEKSGSRMPRIQTP